MKRWNMKLSWKKRLGIRTQLVSSFIVPVICVVLVGTISYQKAESGLKEKYTESTIQALNMVVGYIDYGCELIEAEAFKYAYDTQLSSYYLGLLKRDAAKKASVYNTGKDAIRNSTLVNSMIQGIYVVTGNGIDMITSGTEPVQSGFIDEWKEAEDLKSGWYDGHSLLDEKIGLTPDSYVLNYNCLSDGGKACVVIDVKTDEIKAILDKMELGEECVTAFITSNGKEVFTDTNIEIQFSEQKFYQEALASEEMCGTEFIRYNQENYLFLYSKSDKTESMVCVLVPENEVMGQAYSIRTLTIVLVMLASALALLLGGWISGHIQKNMKTMVKAVEKVAQGNLTVKVTVKGNDEFSVLAEAMNQMITSTKNLLDKMKDASAQLDRSNKEVNETSEEIGHHSRSIMDALEEISKGMEIQSVSAEECQEISNCLSEDIQMISEEVGRVELQMDKTGSMIEQSMHAIEMLNAKSESANEKTQEVENSILVLKEHTGKIENFVNMINDIAGQTNLLSLNASIEAARAGESGRGFSVVAQEIRALAEKSVTSAQEIGRSVEVINHHMEESVKSVQGAGMIAHEQRECVLDMLKIFTEMKSDIEHMFSALNSIVKRVENADGNRLETLNSITSISSVIQETTASVETVANVAENLMVYVKQLDNMAVALDENMGELSREVEKFIVE